MERTIYEVVLLGRIPHLLRAEGALCVKGAQKVLLFDILRVNAPNLKEEDCKIHIAVWNGNKDPVDVFLAGEFEEWQSWQSRKNFERKYIISLLQLSGVDKWLFAGGFRSEGCSYIREENYYRYRTKEINELKELSGRLVVSFARPGRQSYLNAENWSSNITVSEIKPKRMVVEEFPGYNKIKLLRKKLEIIILQGVESWRGALLNVSGVYLIADTKTGKLYIGSATGDGGIWQRWVGYAKNGHGGNKELKKLLKEKGERYSDNFQYSILEIADTHASTNDVLERESHWKDILCSRLHGYNAN